MQEDKAQCEDSGPALGHQNLAAAVMALEAQYRDLQHFTGNLIATLSIERNQVEFEKIPAFHSMAKQWVFRYQAQFGEGRPLSVVPERLPGPNPNWLGGHINIKRDKE